MREQPVYRLCTEVFDGRVIVLGDTGLTWDGDPLVVVRSIEGGDAFACGRSRLVPIDQATAGWGHA